MVPLLNKELEGFAQNIYLSGSDRSEASEYWKLFVKGRGAKRHAMNTEEKYKFQLEKREGGAKHIKLDSIT